MIAPLAQVLASRLSDILGAIRVQAAPFAAAPGKAAVPALAIYPGKMIVQQTVREGIPLVREVACTQQITLGQPKAGPYPLDAPPKAGTLQARRIAPGDPPAPLAAADFRVDAGQPAISFPTSRTARGNLIQVEFMTVQSTRRREISQELWIDTYDESGAGAERWAGLACAVILHGAEAILPTVNGGSGSRIQAFCSATAIRQIELVEGLPLFGDELPGYRLKFAVTGDLQLTQFYVESPAVIRQVLIEQG
ncbi:MAG: hypothetical protein ACOYYS_12840 [Chloroflexota bacterium]